MHFIESEFIIECAFHFEKKVAFSAAEMEIQNGTSYYAQPRKEMQELWLQMYSNWLFRINGSKHVFQMKKSSMKEHTYTV